MMHPDVQPTPAPVEERELIRQLQVTRLLLEEMGGSLPREHVAAKSLETVLDVVCGAGGWALDVAQRNPTIRVTGLDSSELHIVYAQRLANEGGLVNARFLTHDVHTLETGPFEPASFDLINVAFLAPALLHTDYAALMQSLTHQCRPGGLVRWTEMELPLTNSAAFERLMALTCQALDATGHTFVPPSMQEAHAIFNELRQERGEKMIPLERRNLGITPMMGYWLRAAGCWTVESFSLAQDVSGDAPAFPCFLRQVEVFGQQIAPFLIRQGVIAADALAQLLSQVVSDLRREDFCGLCLVLTVYGYLPR